jgi:hypothetical protein
MASIVSGNASRQSKFVHRLDAKAKTDGGAAQGAKAKTDGATSPRRLRLLCLHGYTQNDEIFRKRTAALRRVMKATVDFEFVCAPICVTDAVHFTANATTITQPKSATPTNPIPISPNRPVPVSSAHPVPNVKDVRHPSKLIKLQSSEAKSPYLRSTEKSLAGEGGAALRSTGERLAYPRSTGERLAGEGGAALRSTEERLAGEGGAARSASTVGLDLVASVDAALRAQGWTPFDNFDLCPDVVRASFKMANEIAGRDPSSPAPARPNDLSVPIITDPANVAPLVGKGTLVVGARAADEGGQYSWYPVLPDNVKTTPNVPAALALLDFVPGIAAIRQCVQEHAKRGILFDGMLGFSQGIYSRPSCRPSQIAKPRCEYVQY